MMGLTLTLPCWNRVSQWSCSIYTNMLALNKFGVDWHFLKHTANIEISQLLKLHKHHLDFVIKIRQYQILTKLPNKFPLSTTLFCMHNMSSHCITSFPSVTIPECSYPVDYQSVFSYPLPSSWDCTAPYWRSWMNRLIQLL